MQFNSYTLRDSGFVTSCGFKSNHNIIRSDLTTWSRNVLIY